MAPDDDHAKVLAALAAACEDAVRTHGADWTQVRRQMDAYLAALRPADRESVARAAVATAAHPGEGSRRLH